MANVSIYVASAIAGCFWWESSVNPGVWESYIVPEDTWYHVYNKDGIGGYGFGQWTNTREETGIAWRCRDFYEWAISHNYAPDDGSGQMEYIVNVEKTWYNDSSSRTGATTIEEFLELSSNNMSDLVWDWLANWEGVPGNMFQERLDHAYIFERFIREHKDDDKSQYHWIVGNRFLSEEESANNALLIYWWLGGYDPGPSPPGPDPPGPTPGSSKRKKLWMKVRRQFF